MHRGKLSIAGTTKRRRLRINFSPKNFILSSKFSGDKSILEIGCSPVATVHSISEARFKVEIDIKAGLIVSGLKSLFANLPSGFHKSLLYMFEDRIEFKAGSSARALSGAYNESYLRNRWI